MGRRQHPNRPVVFVWTEHGTMVPLPRFRKLCDELYAVHEEYPLVVLENRNMASHNHYFAAVAEGFQNLAEEFAGKYPTAEHLRADCLIEAGYYAETVWRGWGSKADAHRFALSLRKKEPMARISFRDGGLTVVERTALSQSTAAMKKQEFEDSKAAVLAIVAAMARTTPAQLHREAERITGRKRS
jgi:hypothetical protein